MCFIRVLLSFRKRVITMEENTQIKKKNRRFWNIQQEKAEKRSG